MNMGLNSRSIALRKWRKVAYDYWDKNANHPVPAIRNEILAAGFSIGNKSLYGWRKTWAAARKVTTPFSRANHVLTERAPERVTSYSSVEMLEEIVKAIETAKRVESVEFENNRLRNQVGALKNAVLLLEAEQKRMEELSRRIKVAQQTTYGEDSLVSH